MRYLRLFLLHFEFLAEHRSRSLVWLLISLLNPLLLLLFWQGAARSGNNLSSWSTNTISSYYLLMVIASAFLTAHVEEDISKYDIQYGGLSKYLVRPFSYFWLKFFEELPFRVLQGFYGIIVCIGIFLIFRNFLVVSNNLPIIALSLVVIIFAYFLSFIFKMIIGLLAFWLVDIGGFYQLIEIILLIFAGYLMPLDLLPRILTQVSYILPFSYMIYFPIVSIEGKLDPASLSRVIIVQAIWLFILVFVYKKIWKSGLKKFTALGQ